MTRRQSKLEVSMFPFLSVLCSVIGVMMLFILLIIGTRVVTDTGSAVLLQSRKDGEAIWDAALNDDEIKLLHERIAQMNNRLAARQKELQDVQRLRRRLRELVALKTEEMRLARGPSIVAGSDIGPERRISMIPVAPDDPIDLIKKANFVEVGFQEYTVHPEGTRYRVNELPDEDDGVAPDSEVKTRFEQYLESMYARRESEYIVFLIRPEGTTAFRRAKSYLERKYPPRSGSVSGIDLGWEPFSPEWVYAAREKK